MRSTKAMMFNPEMRETWYHLCKDPRFTGWEHSFFITMARYYCNNNGKEASSRQAYTAENILREAIQYGYRYTREVNEWLRIA